ncbi:hypothetical protein [Pseudomonas sp. DP16D-R1]|jgi:hypothetical protein|uniref:hypothetical protein n=1 Tax=Pseudomonas sp. DP16D-R1 TaxID=2075551 RepID=UPI0011AECBB1|nr:hypothetical protein [Pseudomonas sp. DP16D-R1]
MDLKRSWVHCVLLSGLLAGCTSSQSQVSVSPDPIKISAGTTSGFRVFRGECFNTDADNVNPLLLPLLTNVIS